MRGATPRWCPTPGDSPGVSTHAPHARGDPRRRPGRGCHTSFNPRPSCEGRPRSGRLQAVGDGVSTHAPHARGDEMAIHMSSRVVLVSTHAPHARGVGRGDGGGRLLQVSTPAPHARGDTRQPPSSSTRTSFNPRPACAGRRLRALRGRDRGERFNPRPSCEGRRAAGRLLRDVGAVSTHAPHARGDPRGSQEPRLRVSFNPRPSCEGRQPDGIGIDAVPEFQPTPLMRGATPTCARNV